MMTAHPNPEVIMPVHPKTLLLQKKAADSPLAHHVQQAHPGIEVVEIPYATWAYNGRQHSIEPEDQYREKREKVAVLHRGATWKPDPNGRSTDFLPAVKLGSGCGFFCQYCYVERNNPNSFPKIYDDCLNMVRMVDMVMSDLPRYREDMQRVCHKGFERDRSEHHNPYITFDIGCDTDCTLDNLYTRHADYPGHVIDIMNGIGDIDGAMCSFATKSAEIDQFIEDCTRPEKNRIRLSLMPEHHRRVLEVNTASVERRLDAVNRLVAAGFEVHINLSPIVVTEDFENEYMALLKLIDDSLTTEAKQQMAYEIIFLTHSDVMHERVAARRPEAHAMMAEGPLKLAPKPHKPSVTTYTRQDKSDLKKFLRFAVASTTPYAHIRYMF